MTDLKKAYQAIHTDQEKLHLRWFLFRERRDQDWDDFAFTRATFGDIAAGLIIEVVKRRVAEIGQGIDPQSAQQLQDYCYFDDSLLGSSAEDVACMQGERKDGTYTGTVLAKGAMRVKFMAVSGSQDTWEAELLARKDLGGKLPPGHGCHILHDTT